MNFYLLKSEDHLNEIRFPDVNAFQQWIDHGTSIAHLWKPVALEYIYGAQSKRDKHFDLSQCCDPLFTVSDKALGVLGDILRKNGDILEIASPKGFRFFHCTNVVDALREEESNVTWLDREKGWIGGIDKFVLDKEVVKGQEIFRLPQAGFRYTFFGEEFRRLVISNNLRGVRFDRFETVAVE